MFPSLLGMVVLSLAFGQVAEAQYPRARPGQFEVAGLDFRDNGAWRRRTAIIRLRRQAWLASGQFASLNVSGPGAAATAVTGHYRVPVVPIRYANTDTVALFATYPTAAYQELFFSASPSSRPYSLKTYYEQLANGRITMSGTVFPWVRVDSADTYYEDGCNGVAVENSCPHGRTRFAAMLLQALAKVSNGPDSLEVWAEFDNDGPDGVPNSGDDDGTVDFVTFLQPEIDGACGTANIWAHRWSIDVLNGGSPYVSKTSRFGGGKIMLSDYTIQSGQGGSDACTSGQIMPIGTVAHEFGHAFGLPDLYDTQAGTSTRTHGIGEFGLMGSGNYARPHSPSRMEGWSLLELGWVNADTLKTTGTITMHPVATSDTVWILPTQTTGEYFILENRAAVESDTAQMNPGYSRAKSPGLYLWHIDQGRISQGMFFNTVNAGAIHGVALVEADGLDQLGTPGGGNRGDLGDAFPGSTGNTVVDACTLPGLRTNAGKLVSGRLDSIRIGVDQEVEFRFRMQNLLKASMLGTGTILSSVPINPAGCTGVEPGGDVAITAVPSPGSRFAGWVGDTTAADSVLVVAMDRNWSVTARFVSANTTEAFAGDLLGIASLTAEQRSTLDQLGNNNGSYDLGDFLAWVALSGQGVPPALMSRLLAAAGPTTSGSPKGVSP